MGKNGIMAEFIDAAVGKDAPRRKLPPQKPGRSKQDYATPRIFLDAVKIKFGVKVWAYDLAASLENTVAKHFFCEEEDSLRQDWTKLRGDLFLNPPFADIAPWAAKCATSVTYTKRGDLIKPDRRIFFLVPAAVGSNWWADHVHEKARVIFPRPRLSFDGKNSYPKDISIALYGERPGYEVWRWRDNACKG